MVAETSDDRVRRSLDVIDFVEAGVFFRPRGHGIVRDFQLDVPGIVAESWGNVDPGMRRHQAELSFYRESKPNLGVEQSRARSECARPNRIGLAPKAFVRLERHFLTTGVRVSGA